MNQHEVVKLEMLDGLNIEEKYKVTQWVESIGVFFNSYEL